MRFVKPLDEELVMTLAARHRAFVTIEENAILGGAGSAVGELLAARRSATAAAADRHPGSFHRTRLARHLPGGRRPGCRRAQRQRRALVGAADAGAPAFRQPRLIVAAAPPDYSPGTRFNLAAMRRSRGSLIRGMAPPHGARDNAITDFGTFPVGFPHHESPALHGQDRASDRDGSRGRPGARRHAPAADQPRRHQGHPPPGAGEGPLRRASSTPSPVSTCT